MGKTQNMPMIITDGCYLKQKEREKHGRRI